MAGATGNIKAGRAFVEIMLDQTKLERGLKKAQKTLKDFGDAATNVGKNMLAVSAAMATPFAFSVKVFADFDDEMRMVKGVTGAVGDEFKMLTSTAEKLGRETSFTAKEVAEGMTAMGRMGFKSNEIDNAIESVLNLARATGTDLGLSAEIAANNMRVFGIAASEMTSVADIMTAAANGSAQTLTDLAEGMKMAGPQANAAGDNIRNVAASLGVLANMGIKGSLAGTALRKAYSQFANTRIQGALANYGIVTTDELGNLRAMPAIMADIAKVMMTMPTAKRLAFAEEIFDLRGALAGLQLGGNIDQLNSFIATLQQCDGTAERTAVEMDQGIGGSFRELDSALEGVEIAVGRIISEAIIPYIDSMSLMLIEFSEWIAEHKELVIIMAKAIGILLAVSSALLLLGATFKTLSFIAGTLNTLFVAMKVAIMLPVYALHLLTGAYHLLITAMKLAKVAAIGCWSVINFPALGAVAAIATAVACVYKLTSAWDICANGARSFFSDVSSTFSSIGQIIAQTWSVIKGALAAGDLASAAQASLAALRVIWAKGLHLLQKLWHSFRYMLEDTWTLTVYGVLKLGNNLWHGLLTGLYAIGDAITDTWSSIWNGIMDIFAKTCLWVEKQFIKLEGLFSSDDEATTKRIQQAEEEYETSKRQQDEQFANGVNMRQVRRSEISQKWDSSNNAIEERKSAALIQNQRQYEEWGRSAEESVQSAVADWKSVMEEVRRNTAEKQAQQEAIEKKTRQAASSTVLAAERAGFDSDGKAESFGSWSLKELRGLFGSTDNDERTAKNTENSVRLQQEANRYLKKLSRQEVLSYGE